MPHEDLDDRWGWGQPVSVTLVNVTFAEIDTAKAVVADGCTATVARAKLDGTIMAVGGGGGGGGGGAQCPDAIGE